MIQNNLLTVIDTGAASGRLALIALLTARQAKNTKDPEDVVAFAQKAIAECVELVFIDELKYLVAGGRVSRASGFFGDLLSMKPVISPTSDGVRKVGVVHSRKGQLAFAMEKLREHFAGSAAPVILLQYSDNEEWVADIARPQITGIVAGSGNSARTAVAYLRGSYGARYLVDGLLSLKTEFNLNLNGKFPL